ncbi:hypothetical protein V8V74_20555 [Niallia taxi]
MVRHCDNIIEKLKKSFVIVLVFVLLFEIAPLKKVIKSIIEFAEKNNILMGLNVSDISLVYIAIRKYALIYLIFCIFSFLCIKAYLAIRHYFNSPKKIELNAFEDSLFKYIEDKPNGKGYLITGVWGSGKTFILTEFLNKYFKFSNKPIYRISCFGLDSRKLILDEIKNQIEINDKSFFNWIQYIPAIGKPLFSILKDSYSLSSIPKGSVFIFDDFERITSLGITDHVKNKSYEKDTSLFRTGFRDTQLKEFTDINKEFTKIENAFSKLNSDNELISITNNIQKYNVATGLINELIESYNIKVIIICNVDLLGYDYVDKVFRGKLDCITYNKTIDKYSIESIFKNTLQNQVYSNNNIKMLVLSVMNKILKDFEKVWASSGNNNLRQAKSVVQAFLDTVNIISPRVNLNEEYLISLFYNIYVVRVLRDENKLDKLDYFLVGGNLAYFLKLFRKFELYESIKLIDNFSSIKWTGISISGFWLLNMKKPDNIDEFITNYTNYNYNDLELALLYPESYSWNGEKLLLEHAVSLMMRRETNTGLPPHEDELVELNRIFKNTVEFIINDEFYVADSMEERASNLLKKTGELLSGFGYNSKYIDQWYNSIYSYTGVESVGNPNRSNIIANYNYFVENLKDNGVTANL